MKKPNMSQQVRDYMQANPDASTAEIAFECKVNTQFVHQVKHNLKKKADKPVRTYRKTTLTKKVEPQIINRKSEETKLSSNDFLIMVQAMKDMSEKVVELEHDVIGYKAVINFLEHQLGLRRDNRGATV